MRIKLFTIFIFIFILLFSVKTSFSLSLMDEFNKKKTEQNKEKDLDSLTEIEIEWTAEELEKKMPDFIKDIIIRNKLISWKRDIINHFIINFFSSILIIYVDEDELSTSDIVIGNKDGFNFLTIYPSLWGSGLKKRAEALFSNTGKLLEFKIKKGNQWITIYNSRKQIEI